MKTIFHTAKPDPLLNILLAKLRLKQNKVDRLRRTLCYLESECERLQAEIRRRSL